jgi:hypothetical protein
LSLDFGDRFTPRRSAQRAMPEGLVDKPRAREWESVNKFYIFRGGSEKIYTKMIRRQPVRAYFGAINQRRPS